MYNIEAEPVGMTITACVDEVLFDLYKTWTIFVAESRESPRR
jgi:hypothetical protein